MGFLGSLRDALALRGPRAPLPNSLSRDFQSITADSLRARQLRLESAPNWWHSVYKTPRQRALEDFFLQSSRLRARTPQQIHRDTVDRLLSFTAGTSVSISLLNKLGELHSTGGRLVQVQRVGTVARVFFHDKSGKLVKQDYAQSTGAGREFFKLLGNREVVAARDLGLADEEAQLMDYLERKHRVKLSETPRVRMARRPAFAH